jgi:hypothetical protein
MRRRNVVADVLGQNGSLDHIGLKLADMMHMLVVLSAEGRTSRAVILASQGPNSAGSFQRIDPAVISEVESRRLIEMAPEQPSHRIDASRHPGDSASRVRGP